MSLLAEHTLVSQIIEIGSGLQSLLLIHCTMKYSGHFSDLLKIPKKYVKRQLFNS